jgi:protein phosphatase
VRVDAALLSDVGREREVNEDSGLIIRLHRAGHLATYAVNVYVVADGMGGHEGGEVASDLTVRALQRAIEERIDIDWDDNIAVRAAMLDIIEAVNAEVVALTETDRYRGTRAKPGATLTFAVQLGQRVFIGNVGDSRTYRWNAAQGLQRITKDHSYVQTLIDSGSLSEEDAWDHPDGSIITAHIGMAKLRLRDVFLRIFAPGDKLLLVSDGVVDMLRDRDIEPFLHEHNSAVICRNLVDASNAAGGVDNITVACVAFS